MNEGARCLLKRSETIDRKYEKYDRGYNYFFNALMVFSEPKDTVDCIISNYKMENGLCNIEPGDIGES